MLLALDISLTTGVAFGSLAEGRPRSLCWNLPDGEHNFYRALTGLRENVMALCQFQKVETVVVEAAMRKVDRFHSAYSAYLLMSLAAVAGEAATRAGAAVLSVDCQKWRKTYIGNGGLSGEESKRLAMQRCDQLGWRYPDHNAAEAMGIWYWGMASRFPKFTPRVVAA